MGSIKLGLLHVNPFVLPLSYTHRNILPIGVSYFLCVNNFLLKEFPLRPLFFPLSRCCHFIFPLSCCCHFYFPALMQLSLLFSHSLMQLSLYFPGLMLLSLLFSRSLMQLSLYFPALSRCCHFIFLLSCCCHFIFPLSHAAVT